MNIKTEVERSLTKLFLSTVSAEMELKRKSLQHTLVLQHLSSLYLLERGK